MNKNVYKRSLLTAAGWMIKEMGCIHDSIQQWHPQEHFQLYIVRGLREGFQATNTILHNRRENVQRPTYSAQAVR